MIANLFTALRAGYELSNSAAWKRGGVAVASLTALLSALTGIAVSQGWLPSDIPPETIMQISSGIVAIVGAFLGYVQTATTTRIGIGEAPKQTYTVQEVADLLNVPTADVTFRAETTNAETQVLDPTELSRRIRRGEFAGQHRVVRSEPVPTDRQSDPFWSNPQRGPFLD